jgi:hypothetical protein
MVKMWLTGSAWLGLRKRALTAGSVMLESGAGSRGSELVGISGGLGLTFFMGEDPLGIVEKTTHLTST